MSDNNREIRRIRRLLRALTDLSKEFSMTGSLEKGARLGIRQYNQLLTYLRDEDIVPENLFSANYLDEDGTSFDELGVACTLLETYLAEEEEEMTAVPQIAAPPPPARDLQELRELRELGELIRERLPEMLRQQRGE